MKYSVNNTCIEYQTDQAKAFGKDEVLLKKSIDLSSTTSWHEKGFTIEKLFSSNNFDEFQKGVKNLLIGCWDKGGLHASESFDLSDYHLLADTQQKHLRAIEETKLIDVKYFPGGIAEIEKRISEISNVPVVAKNPFDGQSVFHFRVIRPMSRDNNPLHRDVWLEDYDDCINLYIPIAGSNEKSSLIILPGSHLWPESRVEKTLTGAQIKGVKFNVPAVTAIAGDYSIERPNPGVNEVLVFSPYLIHGGAVNLNEQQTRISIELRLWKKN